LPLAVWAKAVDGPIRVCANARLGGATVASQAGCTSATGGPFGCRRSQVLRELGWERRDLHINVILAAYFPARSRGK
jgi:hypothetical protein